MEIKPIHTDADYKATLREVSGLIDLDPEPATPEGDRLDILATLVQAYEAKHYPIAPPDPIEAIKFRMDQEGLTLKDLESTITPPPTRDAGRQFSKPVAQKCGLGLLDRSGT
jgi:HTH-type transcriptional regulator/antitoxin HigA